MGSISSNVNMTSYLVTLVLCLGAAAFISADTVIDISNATDHGLKSANHILTKKGFGILPLPPFKYNETRLEHGLFIGANSLKRTGDATLTVSDDNSTATVDLSWGHSFLVWAFGKIRTPDVEFTGLIRVIDNSVNFNFTTVHTNSGCHVTLNNYAYVELTGATLSASLPQADGLDLSETFQSVVLPHVNKLLARKSKKIEGVLNHAICKRHHRLHLDLSPLSEILINALVN